MISELWFWETRNGTENHTKLSIFFSVFALLVISCYMLMAKIERKHKVRQPPGPRGLPLIGNLPFLDRDLHSCFARLAETYGPTFNVRLGSKLCIVISSPSVAKEVLKDQDTIFANRDQSAVFLAYSYGGMGMGVAPYGAQWRMLRKLCVKELMSHAKLDALYGLRRREVRHTINQIYSKIRCPITISEKVFETMFNIITSMMWGSTLGKEDRSSITAEFRHVVHKILCLFGETNISDLFPVLARFDLQGKERRMKKVMVWYDTIFNKIVDRGQMENKEENDFLQILLQLIDQGDQKTPLTLTHIKALFLDMIIAGTATASITVEWAMAELMNHPTIMRKVKQELDDVVGMNNIVEESNLSKLQYLDAVLKEVFRLHPAAPLLVPRSPSQSCIVDGYVIPKGSAVFVNVWAIQRDPKYWTDPLEFRPERFLNSTHQWDYNGGDLRYFPFGSGRRICAGIPLAERQVSYLLASLLHSFEWELPAGENLDLSEAFGIELRKKIPLMVIPTPRLLDPELFK